MQKFEYKVVKVDAKGFWSSTVTPTDMEVLLNQLGQDGWDLITAFNTSIYESKVGNVMIFKRSADSLPQ